MKIIIAPDSYKGALRSYEVAAAIAAGWRERRPQDELICLPLADGGEGTCEAVIKATGGSFMETAVHDPLMRPVKALCGISSGGRGVMEMAAASGLELLAADELNPLKSTTFGAGELLRFLLKKQCTDIMMGIGGSATVDGGAGLLQALGARFFDDGGRELAPGIGGGSLHLIDSIDFSGVTTALQGIRLAVACDVTNPLLGDSGSAAVFAPQKGATPGMVAELEENLAHWRRLVLAATAGNGTADDAPGDGAAGGLGFALRRVLKAEIASGAGLVIKLAGLPEALPGSTLLITGEGCSDPQTVCGKLCAVAAGTAAAAGVPAVLVSGALKGNTAELEKLFSGVFSIAAGPGTLTDAIAATTENLRRMGSNLAGVLTAAGN